MGEVVHYSEAGLSALCGQCPSSGGLLYSSNDRRNVTCQACRESILRNLYILEQPAGVGEKVVGKIGKAVGKMKLSTALQLVSLGLWAGMVGMGLATALLHDFWGERFQGLQVFCIGCATFLFVAGLLYSIEASEARKAEARRAL